MPSMRNDPIICGMAHIFAAVRRDRGIGAVSCGNIGKLGKNPARVPRPTESSKPYIVRGTAAGFPLPSKFPKVPPRCTPVSYSAPLTFMVTAWTRPWAETPAACRASHPSAAGRFADRQLSKRDGAPRLSARKYHSVGRAVKNSARSRAHAISRLRSFSVNSRRMPQAT